MRHFLPYPAIRPVGQPDLLGLFLQGQRTKLSLSHKYSLDLGLLASNTYPNKKACRRAGSAQSHSHDKEGNHCNHEEEMGSNKVSTICPTKKAGVLFHCSSAFNPLLLLDVLKIVLLATDEFCTKGNTTVALTASRAQKEISNTTDGESCQKCPENQCPNEKKDTCVLKPTEFLSFKDNLIALVFSTISVLMSVVTSIILVIFILYRDTPIVRANNMNLSFVLLVSIILSFLCVFLFLGRPSVSTCMMRQTAFGILFSVAVSSLLAKTIMVCIAFKATKPSSRWRKYIGVKLPNYVVFICSFIQVVICICWLSISPPYQEMNTHSYPGKIIIQCNEGSVVAFYTVLGYMGFLAAVSFIVAFLARKLPDSFNEAKYITFSMLIFCNVWISFIPAYMSVIGKNTVIVEIFAILASSTGILCSIFFPKCFIILLNPSMNTKGRLLKSGF
ncbi:vomeronasal type-2 receptor 26-like [Spea bombifrons]|uniref:vomeronasal type-2 receptor 26-like n=1 Tax=Spea bombifrons TaxID=233779 RepID=UPI00234BE6DA|nr:vomeronasal type-2 receptor 26-like [Spea bombifrons]